MRQSITAIDATQRATPQRNAFGFAHQRFPKSLKMKTKTNLIIIASAIVCAGALVYALIRFRFFYHDDEMITLR
jgi:hypothetical protein